MSPVTVGEDELIRKGNALMAAARAGRIGFVEKEIRGWQRAYLWTRRVGDSGWAAGMAACVLMVLAGGLLSVPALVRIYLNTPPSWAEQTWDGLPLARVRFEYEIEEMSHQACNGGATVGAGGVVAVLLLGVRSRSRKYTELIENEYPRIEGEPVFATDSAMGRGRAS